MHHEGQRLGEKVTWSAFSRRPRGSQKPSGCWAPISVSKAIFMVEDDRAARCATGAPMNPEAAVSERARTMDRNIFDLLETARGVEA